MNYLNELAVLTGCPNIWQNETNNEFNPTNNYYLCSASLLSKNESVSHAVALDNMFLQYNEQYSVK